MKTKKKDGKKKPTKVRKSRAKKVTVQSARFVGNQHGSKLKMTVLHKDGKQETVHFNAGGGRVTGMAVPLVPYTGTSHEKLKAIMAGVIGAAATDSESAKTYSPEPQGSARGAYTRPARW